MNSKVRRLAGAFLLFSLLAVYVVPTPYASGTNVVIARTGSQQEPSIAANPLRPNILLVGSMRSGCLGNLFYDVSRDGGAQWTGGSLPNIILGSVPAKQCDPVVGFDNFDNAYFVGLAVNTQSADCDQSLFLTRNNGDISGTWSTPYIFMASGLEQQGTICHDKPYLAIGDDGSLFVSWTRFEISSGLENFDIFLVRRLPSGVWQTPVQLSSDNHSQWSDVDVVPNGTVYVSWISSATIPATIYVATYNPVTGAVATSAVATTNAPRPVQQQSLAVDQAYPSAQVLYVAYADDLGTGLKQDIFLVRSTDGGQSWSAPRRVNDDSTPTDQYEPWITTAKGSTSSGIGRVDIVFYDKRTDPTFNSAFETWFAASADRGETFQPNRRVSDDQYDASVDGRHYIGMVSKPMEAQPVWTGQASNRQDQDIITDKVGFFDLEVKAFDIDGGVVSGPYASLDGGAALPTPLVFSTPQGSHTVQVVSCFGNMNFDHWDDGSTSTFRTVTVQGNIILIAHYRNAQCGGGGGGGGVGGGSVMAGSLITMADGGKVPIQNLVVGDSLQGYNKTSGQVVVVTVTELQEVVVDNLVLVRLSDGTVLRTDNNPLQKFWVKTPDGTESLAGVPYIDPGDYLFNVPLRQWVQVAGKEYVSPGQFTMYDILTNAPGMGYLVEDIWDPITCKYCLV